MKDDDDSVTVHIRRPLDETKGATELRFIRWSVVGGDATRFAIDGRPRMAALASPGRGDDEWDK